MPNKTYSFRLKYLADADDMQPKTYSTDLKPLIGDVIQIDNGDYHCITKINQLKSGGQLVLSKSGQNDDAAYLLAQQLGHLQEY